jgi:hypothetical protein
LASAVGPWSHTRDHDVRVGLREDVSIPGFLQQHHRLGSTTPMMSIAGDQRIGARRNVGIANSSTSSTYGKPSFQ